MERYGRLAEMDRSFDIAYWQRLGPTAIFDAAWQMVVDAHSKRPPAAMNSGYAEQLSLFNANEVRYMANSQRPPVHRLLNSSS